MKRNILIASAAIVAAGGIAHAAAPNDRSADVTVSDAQARMAERFDKMDANGDGQLDQADAAARMEQRFARMDSNSDGALSLEEFSARPERAERMERGKRGNGMRDHHGKHMRGGMVMQRMADINDDGVVTRAEFDAAATRRLTAMDADGDGTVTVEERKAAHQAMREMRKQNRDNRAAD